MTINYGKKKLNLLNDNIKLKTRWIDAEEDEVIGKTKPVNVFCYLTSTKLRQKG